MKTKTKNRLHRHDINDLQSFSWNQENTLISGYSGDEKNLRPESDSFQSQKNWFA